MAVFTLEDAVGGVEVIAFPEVYQRSAAWLLEAYLIGNVTVGPSIQAAVTETVASPSSDGARKVTA